MGSFPNRKTGGSPSEPGAYSQPRARSLSRDSQWSRPAPPENRSLPGCPIRRSAPRIVPAGSAASTIVTRQTSDKVAIDATHRDRVLLAIFLAPSFRHSVCIAGRDVWMGSRVRIGSGRVIGETTACEAVSAGRRRHRFVPPGISRTPSAQAGGPTYKHRWADTGSSCSERTIRTRESELRER